MSFDWQPTCSLEHLRLRAQVLATIRSFFFARGVLEVETPLLASATGTDPQLDFFATPYSGVVPSQVLYLQTSPEFAMKRLLANGAGSIFQICKAFRNGEAGRYHNPEFTLLEWYRVGFGLFELMQEVEALFAALFELQGVRCTTERVTYQDIFSLHTGLDALEFDCDAYIQYAIANHLHDAQRLCGDQHTLWLDFIFSHQVQPHLGCENLTLVYSYPQCQSALARINAQDARVADRVEVFWRGVELGNGYYELIDAQEQERRFEVEQYYRIKNGLPVVAKDYKFLAALKSGLPECAGIALGLDRMLMILADCSRIDQVLAFPLSRV